MRCVLEDDISKFSLDNNNVYFQKVKDTSKDGDGHTRLCYTTIYQLVVYNTPRKFYIHFYYDLREDHAKVDISPIIAKILEHKRELDISKIKELN